MAVQWVGPYRIVETLGKGAMGEVYLADDPRLRRRVALKRLSDPDLGSPESRRRLMREARAAARLNHPNVASVYDVVESDDGVHIVMEYVAGQTLAARLRTGRLPRPTAVSIGIQLADALTEAHAMGVIHRDLKPGNVIVTAGERVKVLDFGLARTRGITGGDPAWSASRSSDAGDGQVAGTPPYMAPEAFFGHGSDVRTDLYSLGVTLFEMLTGRRPYGGEDMQTVRTAVLSGPTPRIREIDPDLPASLDAVVARSMARNIEDRYGSAAELADALRGEFMDAPTMSGRSWTHLVGGRRARRRGVVALAAVALLAAVTPWLRRPPQSQPASTPGSAVVAVLPLMNTTGDPANDRLGIGIADVLTSTLARVPGVTMISRSATLSYQKPDRDLPSIARELGADLIVDGAVQASKDTVRVTLNLLRAEHERGGLEPRLRRGVQRDVRPADGSGHGAERGAADHAHARRQAAAAASTHDERRGARGLRPGAQFLERADVKGNLDRSVSLFESALRQDPRFAAAMPGWARPTGCDSNRRATRVVGQSIVEARNLSASILMIPPVTMPSPSSTRARPHGSSHRGAASRDRSRARKRRGAQAPRQHALRRGRREKARRAQAGDRLRPNFWGNHYNLGACTSPRGDITEAEAAFQRVSSSSRTALEVPDAGDGAARPRRRDPGDREFWPAIAAAADRRLYQSRARPLPGAALRGAAGAFEKAADSRRGLRSNNATWATPTNALARPTGRIRPTAGPSSCARKSSRSTRATRECCPCWRSTRRSWARIPRHSNTPRPPWP